MRVLILALLLGGCAATGVPPMDIAAGDVGGDMITETKNTVENIYGMNTKELLIMCILAGWAIPSPWEMISGIGKMCGLGVRGCTDLFRYVRG